MNFGKNLAFFRKSMNVSQEELALSLGVSRQTIYTWESNIASPNVLMLKKISSVLNVTFDELINGPIIDKLPNKIDNIILEYVSAHEPITVTGILDLFIKFEKNNEIAFSCYDNKAKINTYHLKFSNEIIVHDKKGFEVNVEQFDKNLYKEKNYSLVVGQNDDKVQFIAKIDFINEVRKIQTYKDKEFIKNWGDETSTCFENAKNFILKYGEKEYKVIQISYFICENIYIECYLDENFETILWKRFDKDRESNEIITINNKNYGYYYEIVTDRINKLNSKSLNMEIQV